MFQMLHQFASPSNNETSNIKESTHVQYVHNRVTLPTTPPKRPELHDTESRKLVLQSRWQFQTRASYKHRCQIRTLHHTAGWSTRRIATALSFTKCDNSRCLQYPRYTEKALSSHDVILNIRRRRKFITSSATTRKITCEEIRASYEFTTVARYIICKTLW
jgi:hypothetical protein